MNARRLTAKSPAKLNLGLEVIERRSDGYHEISTVMQTVSLYDTLTLVPAETLSIDSSVDEPMEANLIYRAAQLASKLAGREPSVHIHLEKAIPVAAGLGGASSNAAVTLRLLFRHWGIEFEESELYNLASQLGSDVPFFLRGGTAWATGRGEALNTLTALRPCWFVIVIPGLTIPRKTATLYSQLTPEDFSSGAQVRAIVQSIEGGNIPSITDLPNAFARPLYRIAPELETLDDLFLSVGAPRAAISGAGPAHFTIVPDKSAADTLVASLRCRLDDSYRVYSAIPIPSMPLIWT